MRSKVPILCLAAVLGLCLIMTGCAGRQPGIGSPEDRKALDLAQKARKTNTEITSCKGTAWLTIRSEGKPDRRFRLAWAAVLPDKLRMTLLSAGLPMETISADGKRVTFVSHNGSHEPYTLNSPDPSLAKVLSIPVSLTEVLAILAGRVPAESFDRARWSDTGSGELRAMILARKWRGDVGRLYWSPTDEVHLFQSLDREYNLVYSLYRDDIRDLESFRIPFGYRIADTAGRTLILEITRFQPNIMVEPSVFSLTDSRE